MTAQDLLNGLQGEHLHSNFQVDQTLVRKKVDKTRVGTTSRKVVFLMALLHLLDEFCIRLRSLALNERLDRSSGRGVTTKVHLPGPKPRVIEKGRSQMKYQRENNTWSEPAQADFIQEDSTRLYGNRRGGDRGNNVRNAVNDYSIWVYIQGENKCAYYSKWQRYYMCTFYVKAWCYEVSCLGYAPVIFPLVKLMV